MQEDEPMQSKAEIVFNNVSNMMAELPVHSHHRAPLVHALSKGMSSPAAAAALHTSASYVRQCKRKDYSDADLYHDKSVWNENKRQPDWSDSDCLLRLQSDMRVMWGVRSFTRSVCRSSLTTSLRPARRRAARSH